MGWAGLGMAGQLADWLTWLASQLRERDNVS